MSESIFDAARYSATGLSVTTAATAAIVLTIGVFLFARARNSQAMSRFLTLTAVAAAWLATSALAYSSSDPELSLWWARLAQLPLALLPAAGLSLAAANARPHRALRLIVFAGWAVCGATGLLAAFTTRVVAGVVNRPWGQQAVSGPGLIVVALVSAAAYGLSVFILWSAFRLRDGEASDRAGLLLLAFLLASPVFLDVLPMFGIEVYPVGYIAIFALTIIAGVALGQFASAELTPQFAATQILETMKNAVILVDMEANVRVMNRAAGALLGYPPDEIIGMPMREMIFSDEYSSTRRILNSTGVLEQVMGWKTASGARVDVLTSSSFVRGSDGVPIGVVYVASDYTDRKRAEQRLRESEARYRLLFERNLAGVYRTTVDGRILDCNDAFARMFGYDSRGEMLVNNASALYFEPGDRDEIIRQLKTQRAVTNHEARLRRKDNEPVWVLENMTLLDDGRDESGVIEGTLIDITDRKTAQQRVEYQAWHDVLTSLPNRLLFRDRLQLALAHARRGSHMLAVMYVDLDGFKAVNDSLGHTIGDRLLQAVGSRLVDSVRSEDTVARIGGDEFTILLPELMDGRGASTVAQKIIDSVAAEIVIDDHVLRVTPSIGIALFPGDGFDADALLKSADRAMYRAKQLGRNNYQFATPPPFDDRASLQRRLGDALRNDEFVLHYQPIVDIATGEVRAVEALLRWNDPQNGLRYPDAFLAAAEGSDVMLPLGQWVLRSACAQLRRWRESHPALRVGVNLFARQFQQRDLVATIAQTLASEQLPPSALQIEITEAAAMSNAEQSLVAMQHLKDAGIAIAIDDFGTGYSSFRYLRRLPVDTVKVDQELVRGIVSNASDRAAVSALISMARALGVNVVAEGVETVEQLEILRAEGCSEMQGYLHTRPLPAAELDALLSAPLTARAADKVSRIDA